MRRIQINLNVTQAPEIPDLSRSRARTSSTPSTPPDDVLITYSGRVTDRHAAAQAAAVLRAAADQIEALANPVSRAGPQEREPIAIES